MCGQIFFLNRQKPTSSQKNKKKEIKTNMWPNNKTRDIVKE